MLLWASFYVSFAVFTTSEGAFSLRRNGTRQFPDGFLFGAATAAYQIEGAWNVDGRGPSVWYEFIHSHPERIIYRQNGDIAANSYEYFFDDIAAVENMEMNHYQFSIAWPRVLPDGDVSNVNEKGIEYYNKIIDKLLELNIEPMVTMYHFDLPQALQELGGMTNPILIDYFAAYAKLLFERFGDRVKYWITFNEPLVFCTLGYGNGLHALGLNISGIGEYLCGHNVLKVHVVVYRMYRKSYYDRFKGQIGITYQAFYYYSERNDAKAVDRAMQFMLGWLAAPIISSTVEAIGENSMNEGRSRSKFPTFPQK